MFALIKGKSFWCHHWGRNLNRIGDFEILFPLMTHELICSDSRVLAKRKPSILSSPSQRWQSLQGMRKEDVDGYSLRWLSVPKNRNESVLGRRNRRRENRETNVGQWRCIHTELLQRPIACEALFTLAWSFKCLNCPNSPWVPWGAMRCIIIPGNISVSFSIKGSTSSGNRAAGAPVPPHWSLAQEATDLHVCNSPTLRPYGSSLWWLLLHHRGGKGPLLLMGRTEIV